MNTERQKAVGYVRVSTEDQAKEGVSLEAQRAKIEAYCKLNEFELIEIYEEEKAISGRTIEKRKGVQAAIDRACSEQAVLVAYSLSRLSRSTYEALGLAQQLQKSGAHLASITERFDTSGAIGKFIFRQMASVSEFEIDLLSERTRMALHHKRSKGERTGNVPYGFDLASDGVRLIANDYEQSIIAWMRKMREAGGSLREIADILNERHVPAKCPKRRDRAPTNKWRHTSVRAILNNDRSQIAQCQSA